MPDDASTCGWMIKRSVYPSADAVASALAADILHHVTAASRPTPVALMLAGGRTPKAAYQRLAASGQRVHASLIFMISDERWVPFDHPDSNYWMLRPMLDALACPPAQQIMVNTTLECQAAARDFGHRIGDFMDRGGVLDTCYLGLGADGHTASLFTEQDLLAAENHNAIAVNRPDGKIGISVTPPVIRRARRIVFVVTGADKQDIMRKFFSRPQETIAGRAVFRHPRVEVWMDQAASP